MTYNKDAVTQSEKKQQQKKWASYSTNGAKTISFPQGKINLIPFPNHT